MVGCWYKDWLKRGIYAARGVTVIVGVLPDGGILVSVATTAGVEVHVSVRTGDGTALPSPVTISRPSMPRARWVPTEP